MRIPLLIGAAALLLCATVPGSSLAAQDTAGAFIIQLGTDTIAVESFAITGNRLEGELLNRVPSTTRQSYTGTLRADGSFSVFEITRYASPESDSVAQRTVMRFGPDSIVTEAWAGQELRRRAATSAPRTTLPFLNSSFAMHELAHQRARQARQDSITFPFLSPGAPTLSGLEVHRHGADSLTARILFSGGGEVAHAGRTDAPGHLLELRGIGGSYGSNVSRSTNVDMAALRRDFAARDRAGRGMGQLSPRDTTRAQVGGASIEIDYGRPSARGRTILGGLIHEGVVWRLGANQATHLTTSRDLAFGELLLPAGSYSMFAIPDTERWTLIINRETQQAGTAHDESQDLGRVPMSVSRAPSHQEQLTIEVGPATTGGVLRILWGDIVAEAPFTVR